MKLLALDTATEACSVALQVGDAVTARHVVAGRSHTQILPRQVAEVLADAGLSVAELDGVICGIGPGSFAGLRIGLSYAKGLAMVADLPTVGVSSLQMLAGPTTRADRVLTVIDARLSAVYAAAWQRDAHGHWQVVMAPILCAPEALPAAPDPALIWQARGSGFAAYREALVSAWGAPISSVDDAALPNAQQALAIGRAMLARGEGVDAARLQPLYLRNKVALTRLEQQALRAPRGV
ncbi:tRNA (adenosine(37)-N6)-threonylcarbamoyltransferase complex dimerization subunit type 1 TsaB [Polycyclovorans algicola]|uniref:tRNA (adenosine(37)-N6)-threonylcarbamoyltransferase complex dimerization subunit type 1 TsaB n=1 Tax=Polycyclovorans algicola TaxID=616992 RepID=UPI0004A7497D|nr:tRNA (adenosine(37)-N6)-threonylcarbamoyltransferase complex dimerization subunit type 1 TsaB [Polycyclovorans algicola]